MRIDKKLLEILRGLGLSENEAAVYLAGLELGSAKASAIAKKAELNRPLAYQTIDGLGEKGLVSKTGPHYGTLFTMEPPSRLKDLLKRKEDNLKTLGTNLDELLPALNSLSPSSIAPSRIRFYEGAEGLRNIAEDVLKSEEKEMLALVPIENVFEIFNEKSVLDWQKEREKAGIQAKSIWSNHHEKLDPNELFTERRFIPRDMQPFPSTIVVYDNKVVVFSSPEKLFAFAVESNEFSQTMRSIFGQLWMRAESIPAASKD